MKWKVIQFMQKQSMSTVIGGHWMGFWNKAVVGTRSRTVESRFVQAFVARRWSFLLVVMGFLLGRAMILEQLSPFALAFFAVSYFLRKDLLPWIGVALFTGSMLSMNPHSGYLVTEMIVFLLLQKALEKYERSDLSLAPLLVLSSTFLVQLFANMVQTD
jgi:stage II sporulation protein E